MIKSNNIFFVMKNPRKKLPYVSISFYFKPHHYDELYTSYVQLLLRSFSDTRYDIRYRYDTQRKSVFFCCIRPIYIFITNLIFINYFLHQSLYLSNI